MNETADEAERILSKAEDEAGEIIGLAHQGAAEIARLAYQEGLQAARMETSGPAYRRRHYRIARQRETLLAQSESEVLGLVRHIAQTMFGSGW
jgi:flagellar biosynthesis/type III secretory pathway protein FliH